MTFNTSEKEQSSSQATYSPVLIIGAGLAGLALASVLEANNVPYLLFESASRDSPSQGYGITMRSWAYEPLLDLLPKQPLDGMGSNQYSYFQKAVASDAAIGGLGAIDTKLRDAYTGQILLDLSPPSSTSDSEMKSGPPHFRANRGRIRSWFLSRLDPSHLKFGWKLQDVHHKDAGSVVARFHVGDSQAEIDVIGEVLVAADGVHSSVRRQLLPDVSPAVLESIVYNGDRTIPRSEFDQKFAPHIEGKNVIAGAADDAFMGLSVKNITQGKAQISWTYSRPGSNDGKSYSQGQMQTDLAAAIAEKFGKSNGSAEPFRTLLTETNRDHLYCWPMRSVRTSEEELTKATDAGVVLIGDAVHAM